MAGEFRVGGGLQDLPGAVPARKHKLAKSNIEQAENEKMNERRLAGIKEKFPMHVHKPGGLWKQVEDDDQLEAALAKGWVENLADVMPVEQPGDGSKVSQMTPTQAAEYISANANDADALVAIEADERAHGARADVLKLIEAAKDDFGPKAPAKAPAKAPKGAKK